MIRLDNKVAIVTGGGRGLGRAYALALAHAGARVVVNDLGVQIDGSAPGDDSAGAVVGEIRRTGGHAIANTDSVADPAGVERLFESTLALLHRIDVVVNNAGIVRSRPIVDMTNSDFDEVLAVHLRGTFLCTRAAMRVMREAERGGRIINTTSGQAYHAPAAGTANYAAAKGGIVSLTRVAAVEGQDAGITCNAVSPLARTRMAAQFLAGNSAASLEPEAIAPLVVFLASDRAAGISGRVLRVARDEIAFVDTAIGRAIQPVHGRWTAEEIAERIKEIMEIVMEVA